MMFEYLHPVASKARLQESLAIGIYPVLRLCFLHDDGIKKRADNRQRVF